MPGVQSESVLCSSNICVRHKRTANSFMSSNVQETHIVTIRIADNFGSQLSVFPHLAN